MVNDFKDRAPNAFAKAPDAGLKIGLGAMPPPSKAFGRAFTTDRIKRPIIIPEELQWKIDDAGDTPVELDQQGRLAPRFCQSLCRSLKNSQSPSERIDSANAAKTALGMNGCLDKPDAESIAGALASCLDEGDMQLRLTAILGLFAYASAKGDIKEHLEALAKRLDDIAPINRKAALLALEAYANQGEKQAESAMDSASSSKNKDALDRISTFCGIGFDLPKAIESDEILTLVHSLDSTEYEQSLDAFEKLNARAIGSSECAFEILILLDMVCQDDPLVKDLKETCLEITKDAEKEKIQAGSSAGSKA